MPGAQPNTHYCLLPDSYIMPLNATNPGVAHNPSVSASFGDQQNFNLKANYNAPEGQTLHIAWDMKQQSKNRLQSNIFK